MKKRIISLLAAAVTVAGLFCHSFDVQAAVARESTVSEAMTTAGFWVTNAGERAGNLLMSPAQIDTFNARALQSQGAHMYDLAGYASYTDALQLFLPLWPIRLLQKPQARLSFI